MKKAAVWLICFALVLGKSNVVAAHLPHVIEKAVTVVKRPEISQAFYADLEGEAEIYRIVSARDFFLHVGLLVPDLPHMRKDFLVEILSRKEDKWEQLSLLDGNSHTWNKFFEPFAGDRYWQGPEISKQVQAGEYLVYVSNPDNEGKYVLIIGKKDSFKLSDLLATIKRLPQVKLFLAKNPWTAYFNLMGLFILLAVSAGIAIILLLYRLVKAKL